jgi:hypothetical protein
LCSETVLSAQAGDDDGTIVSMEVDLAGADFISVTTVASEGKVEFSISQPSEAGQWVINVSAEDDYGDVVNDSFTVKITADE